MKTKDEGWVKGSYLLNISGEDEPKVIENGRIYKCFGLDMSSQYRTVTHIPTKTRIGVYQQTLNNIKELLDMLLEVDIDWNTTDNDYFQNIDKATKDKIYKIITSLQ